MSAVPDQGVGFGEMLREVVLRGSGGHGETVRSFPHLAHPGQRQKPFTAMEIVYSYFFHRSLNPFDARRQAVPSATSAAVFMLSAEILSMVSASVCQ